MLLCATVQCQWHCLGKLRRFTRWRSTQFHVRIITFNDSRLQFKQSIGNTQFIQFIFVVIGNKIQQTRLKAVRFEYSKCRNSVCTQFLRFGKWFIEWKVGGATATESQQSVSKCFKGGVFKNFWFYTFRSLSTTFGKRKRGFRCVALTTSPSLLATWDFRMHESKATVEKKIVPSFAFNFDTSSFVFAKNSSSFKVIFLFFYISKGSTVWILWL